jgi:hypothetical protein
MTRKPKALLALGVAICWMHLAGAQTAPPPHYSPGDSWVYVGATPAGARGPITDTINAVGGESIDVKRLQPRSGLLSIASKAHAVRVSRWMNEIGVDGRENLLVKHPLAVGNRWDYSFLSESADRKSRFENVRTARVVGIERINVPAGEFECFKIVSSGTFREVMAGAAGGSGGMEETAWYCPEVNRVARYVRTVSGGAQGTARELRGELEEYTPGGNPFQKRLRADTRLD